MNKWLRRILKGLAILVGVLVVLAIGLAGYVQLFSDRPLDRPVRQMKAPQTRRRSREASFSTIPQTCVGSVMAPRAVTARTSHKPESQV